MAAVAMSNEDTTTTRDLREDMDASGEIGEWEELPVVRVWFTRESRGCARGIFGDMVKAFRQFLMNAGVKAPAVRPTARYSLA
jgi:hypothetical protein